ncbi:Cof-type HAD-IIB family hydrolase [Paenibacillus timonensis]|jgi:5-amino-6-(5-phospho-D-ribitylamino)uracil phosphatase|uniref:Cof-type HAD-IIB family hydrolase n=1 Tax=Paenibacillus timonensis TaxID=225915 RepID=A0ABW3SCY8_9BACL|nr:Cof-type HAD-IIB family hydrolase [Paenibacillus timonensis]MCH1641131.1 Cof-type HAD-IIB family hydrolase [Paenibacillus timonensis]
MKLIAVDLDGTLLTSDSRPSSQGLDAISHAVSKGHAVTLCTGRASFDARHLTGELSIPIIASNGAEVFDREGKLLRETPIDPGAAAEAVRYLLKHNVYFEIFCPEAIYSPSDGEQKLLAEMDMLVSANPNVDRDKLWESAKIQFVQFGFRGTDQPLQLLEQGRPVYKLLVYTFNEDKLNEITQHFDDQPQVHTTSSANHIVEVIAKETDKGSALRFLADHLGVDMSDTVVIGDSYNDISMFEAAGTKIAMGNAVDDIKRLATVTTKTNNDHGVAYAIRSLLEI